MTRDKVHKTVTIVGPTCITSLYISVRLFSCVYYALIHRHLYNKGADALG